MATSTFDFAGTVLLIGDGPSFDSAIDFARLLGAREILVASPNVQLLRDVPEHVVPVPLRGRSVQQAVNAVLRMTSGRGADLVMEFTGTAKYATLAARCLAPHDRALLVRAPVRPPARTP